MPELQAIEGVAFAHLKTSGGREFSGLDPQPHVRQMRAVLPKHSHRIDDGSRARVRDSLF